MTSLNNIPSQLAWTFTHVLPGNFRRNKAQFAHHEYPILAPLPPAGPSTPPVEGAGETGPFLYFVVDAAGRVCYVGKCKEKTVIKRWVRPGVGGPAKHYWTHSTAAGGNVFELARGLSAGQGPYELRFTTLQRWREVTGAQLGIGAGLDEDAALSVAEQVLIKELAPAWNVR